MSREPNSNIFVHGLPIDLEKNGLINLFCKAGEIVEAKIIQPTHGSNITYGFIRFKNATQAAIAIDMFNNYLIGNQKLTVKFGRSNKDNGDDERAKSSAIKTLEIDDDDDWETVDPKSIPPKPRSSSKISTSESFTKSSSFDYDFSTPFDMSKPYARRLVEKYLKKIDDFNERHHNQKKNLISSMDPPEIKLKIGQTYKVNITHVNTPSNFFVQLVPTINNTANMLNNLDNHYRNEIDDPELKNGFSTAPGASFRCKLHNLRCLQHETEWSQKTNEIFEKLARCQQDENKSENVLYMKIYGIDILDPDSNRFDAIYSVDLGVDNNEWVSSFLLEQNLAIKIGDPNEVKNMNLYYKNQEQYEKYSSTKLLSTLITENNNDCNYNQNNYQDLIEEPDQSLNLTFTTGSFYNHSEIDISDSISTIETGPDFMRRLEEHNRALLKHMPLNNKRNKMFNGKFKIWKKRDFMPSFQRNICGQIFDVRISNLISSQKLFIQRVDNIEKLTILEDSIQNFVATLLREEPSLEDFISFQENSNKLDAVLVKSSSDSKWRRAILMEKCNQSNLIDELNEALEIKDVSKMIQKEYYTFFLIDWGIEDLKIRYPNQTDLFILPLNEKLLSLGPLALECSLDLAKIKTRDKCGQTILRESTKFETLLKKYMNRKHMTARISHFTTIRHDTVANVELFYLKNDFDKLIESIADLNCSDPNDTFSSSFFNLSQAKNLSAHDVNSMLNCINLISKIMENDNNEEKPDEESFIQENNQTSINHVTSSMTTQLTTTTTTTNVSSKVSTQQSILHQEEKHSQLITVSPKNTNATQVIKSTSSLPPSKYPIKSVEMETLKKGTFLVQLQHFDPTYVDQHFYLTLKENFDALLQLDQILQEEIKDSKKFTQITRLDQFKVGDVMEALFDEDEKWYRVSIRNIDSIENYFEIYFLDFGNSQRIYANSNDFKSGKLLRVRNYYDSQEESRIFDLKYQAIKCKYAVYTENKFEIKYKNVQEFLNSIEEKELEEFDVKVINISEDYDDDKFELTRVSYGVYLLNKDENNNDPTNDDEVSSILEKKETLIKPQAVYNSPKKVEPHSEEEIQSLNSYNLKQDLKNDSNSLYVDTLIKDANMSAILILTENTNEFYVHLESCVVNLLKISNLMRNLLNNIPAQPIKTNNNRPIYQLGDFVFVHFLNEWKRAIVIDLYENKYGNNNMDEFSSSFSSQLNLKIENDPNGSTSSFKSNTDNYIYTVYFVDYGSKETRITSNSMRPIKCILEKDVKTNLSKNDLKSLIELPFMAVGCEFDSNIIINSVYNTEILKSIVKDYYNFTIRIKSVTKKDLFTAKLNPGDKEDTCFQIRKYVISLYADNQLLDDKFEKIIVDQKPAGLPPKPRMRVTPSPPPVLIESKLDKDSLHLVSLASLNETGETYVNLVDRMENLKHLESKIKLNKVQIEANAAKLLNWLPNVGDLVLAKYYQDQELLSTSSYDWYRAVVTKIDFKKSPNRFEVLYLDYGNTQDDLLLSDLVKLPNEYDFNKYEIFGYCTNLNKISINQNMNKLQEQVLEEFFRNETFYMKVIDNTKLNSNNLTQYDVEFWTTDDNQKQCLNKLLDPRYKSYQIETINLVDLYENSPTKPLKITTKYSFMDDIDQLHFVLDQDISERDKLHLEINQHYTSKELAKETLPAGKKFKKSEYYACLNENKWYRVKITSVTDDDQICLFFIDYGYNLKIDKSKVNLCLRKLNNKFMNQPQFCFSAYLFDVNKNEKMSFDSKINIKDLEIVFEKFLSANSNQDVLNMNVYTKDAEDDLFGVLIFNQKGDCLNKMLHEEIERLMNKKPPRPKLIKLKHADLPKQRSKLVLQPDKDIFLTYAQKLDYFYVFEKGQVDKIQIKVQHACNDILFQESNFEFDNSIDLPQIGDVCFGKYEDMWYRCKITNLDVTNNKYELFYFDFGNVEITGRDDILFGFHPDHVEVFLKEQPAAFQCKLYDLMPLNGRSTFSQDVNLNFKNLVDDNYLSIDVIRKNDDDIFEIEIHEIDQQNIEERVIIKHIHDDLIKSKLVELPRFDVCLTNAKTQAQIDFYIKLLKRFNA